MLNIISNAKNIKKNKKKNEMNTFYTHIKKSQIYFCLFLGLKFQSRCQSCKKLKRFFLNGTALTPLPHKWHCH